jgi:cystathionine beta-lyase/cystathionine gamma-synthase
MTDAAVTRFVDALRLFKIGFSWGGVTSLVMGYPPIHRTAATMAAASSGSTSDLRIPPIS